MNKKQHLKALKRKLKNARARYEYHNTDRCKYEYDVEGRTYPETSGTGENCPDARLAGLDICSLEEEIRKLTQKNPPEEDTTQKPREVPWWLEGGNRGVLLRALQRYIAYLDNRLAYLATWKHLLWCRECRSAQGACAAYFEYDGEKESTKELIGLLEKDTLIVPDWLTPKVYKGASEEETEEDLS